MEAKEFEFNIPISQEQIGSLEIEPQTLLDFIPAAQTDKLKDFVFDALGNKDGSPEVGNLKVAKFKFDKAKNKGSFRLKFDIDRRYCCSDTESCSSDYVDFVFTTAGKNMLAKGNYFDWTLNN
ncbi:hypothetical protein [Sphingobacterium lactis]|uniref:Uncharacterized protein n=1 Tax=Sphingobacterium lactis TaxID=797291 RepID=A0A1H6C0U5_9SPHI|nr:hypothetical protein [Sphingobacterium lactis]SEG66568.1 hypothetical protein SAMN05421877_112120 [Sphingobacterium lactis]